MKMFGDSLLVKSNKWLGNQKSNPDKKEKTPEKFFMDTICAATWNFGNVMSPIFKDLLSDFGATYMFPRMDNASFNT
jgi:hypothetical protein